NSKDQAVTERASVGYLISHAFRGTEVTRHVHTCLAEATRVATLSSPSLGRAQPHLVSSFMPGIGNQFVQSFGDLASFATFSWCGRDPALEYGTFFVMLSELPMDDSGVQSIGRGRLSP